LESAEWEKVSKGNLITESQNSSCKQDLSDFLKLKEELQEAHSLVPSERIWYRLQLSDGVGKSVSLKQILVLLDEICTESTSHSGHPVLYKEEGLFVHKEDSIGCKFLQDPSNETILLFLH
jgi:hypothetical protein